MTESGSHIRLFFGLKEVARMLNISERTLRREIQRGNFPQPVKIANRCMISRSGLDAYLQQKGVSDDVG